MYIYKIVYDDTRSLNSWRAHILATSRENAENVLRKRVEFPFSITNMEELCRIDAMSQEAADIIINLDNKNKKLKEELQNPKNLQSQSNKVTNTDQEKVKKPRKPYERKNKKDENN